MKAHHKPVRTTIIYGLVCSLLFVPLSLVLNEVFFWPKAFNLTIWLYLAGYGILLSRWGGKSLSAIFFPIALLLVTFLWNLPVHAFLFLSLGILSWVRSGICFEKNFFRMLIAECFLCLGGASLVAGFSPHSSISLAIGIFLFALVQSLYFVLFVKSEIKDEQPKTDPFEVAMKKGRGILGNGIS